MGISSAKLQSYITVPGIFPKIFKTLPSTNLTAKEMGLGGEKTGTLIIAEGQTAGKGRLGRNFYSPENTGVYFSLILRPTVKPEDTVLITALAGVSVCQAITEVCSKKPEIKWVNDVFVEGKKVAGILAETVFVGGLPLTVLGIGINLFSPKSGFPEDIKDIAGFLFNTKKTDIKEKIIAITVNRFMTEYGDILNPKIPEKYREFSLIIGKDIIYFQNGKKFSAKVLDIDNRCNLIVRLKDGTTEKLSTGEITIGSGNVAKK